MAAQVQRLVGQVTKLVSGVVSQQNAITGKVLGVYRSPQVQTFVANAKNELGPPPVGQIPTILKKGFGGMGGEMKALGDSTVKEATVKLLTVFEVGCWFLVGEIIGRRSVIGYKFGDFSSKH